MGGGKKEKRSQAEGAKAKDPSWNFYYCPYILRTGEECNWRCYSPKGCKVHRDSRQVACKESGCDEMTRSRYDYCDTHAKKHRSREHYHRKKQAKMASAEIPIGNLEVNENIITCH
ncbi:unnamed protein product [Rhizophagus irregularis]|nr:unnamed protein product [Rhizophagus irregularis]